MTYTELICHIKDNDINKDIIIAYLSVFEFESFVEEQNMIKAYIKSDYFDFESIISTFKDKELIPKIDFTYKTIAQKNWNQEWESNYKPVIIDNRCIIRSSFHKNTKTYDFDILIDPKMSFGTGHHETTCLMISAMLETDFKNKHVLDMGSGTGILSILASKKGAKSVLAVDIDKWALENTVENIKLNKVNGITAKTGGIEHITNTQQEIILANINKNVLLQQIPTYSNIIKTNGILLISGFFDTDLQTIVATAKCHGFQLTDFKEKNKWIVAMFKK